MVTADEAEVPVRAEFLVEPFVEGRPGPHVEAVIASLRSDGLTVDMGPFASTVEGTLSMVLDSVERAFEAGFGAGASSVQLRVERVRSEPT